MANEKLTFDAEKHIYLRGAEVVPSVSAVLRRAYTKEFDFSMVDPLVLKRSAEYGTGIHNDIENWLACCGLEPTPSLEFDNFKRWWLENNMELINYEQIVDGGWYAGMYDIKALNRDTGRTVLIDLKTTSSTSKPKWSKQLTMYNFIERCDEILVLWLHNEKFRVLEIDYLGDEFVEETRRLYLSD